jgi:hypothetical protein
MECSTHWSVTEVRSLTGEIVAGICNKCRERVSLDRLTDVLIENWNSAEAGRDWDRMRAIRAVLMDICDARDAWDDLIGA